MLFVQRGPKKSQRDFVLQPRVAVPASNPGKIMNKDVQPQRGCVSVPERRQIEEWGWRLMAESDSLGATPLGVAQMRLIDPG